MIFRKENIKCCILFYCIIFFSQPVLHAQPSQLYFNHLTTDNGLSQGVVTNILVDKKGFTWFTSYDGINRFDGTNCISNSQIGPGMEGISVTRGITEDKLVNKEFDWNGTHILSLNDSILIIRQRL